MQANAELSERVEALTAELNEERKSREASAADYDANLMQVTKAKSNEFKEQQVALVAQ